MCSYLLFCTGLLVFVGMVFLHFQIKGEIYPHDIRELIPYVYQVTTTFDKRSIYVQLLEF